MEESLKKKKDRDMGGKRKGLNWVKTEEHTGGQEGRQHSSLRHAGTGKGLQRSDRFMHLEPGPGRRTTGPHCEPGVQE